MSSSLRRSIRKSSRPDFFVPHFEPNNQTTSSEMTEEPIVKGLPKARKSIVVERPKKRRKTIVKESERSQSIENQENETLLTNQAVSKTDMGTPSEGKSEAVRLSLEVKSNKQQKPTSEPKKRKTKRMKINEQLLALGFEESFEKGNCARAAIHSGYIKFSGHPSDLEQVILSGKLECGHNCKAKLRDLLQQSDLTLYNDKSCEKAAVHCDEDGDKCVMGRTYVTGICEGNPRFDKFHAHIYKKREFGKCYGDFFHELNDANPEFFNLNAVHQTPTSREISEEPIVKGLPEARTTIMIEKPGKRRKVTVQDLERSRSIENQENETLLANQAVSKTDMGPSSNGKSEAVGSSVKAKSKKQKGKNPPTEPRKRKTKKEKINEQLLAIGVKPSSDTGNCTRAAIYSGFIKLTGHPSDLEQVILSGKLECGHTCKAKLRDLLKQPDYAGIDYEDGCRNATVHCEQEECDMGRTYVTQICRGKPEFDCGRSHNHCNECNNFGKCIGDYRQRHCYCGTHYFGGLTGQFSCHRCGSAGDCVII